MMDITEPENVKKWAIETFGSVECGDPRRTDRLIKVASALANNPSASLPCVLETWGETLGAYRLLENPAMSYGQIITPHWSQTYHEATQGSRTLLLGDTTEMDFSTHKAVKGLAPIGNPEQDISFSVHTVLAMDPQTQRLLGCITQEPFRRKLAPKGKRRNNGKNESGERESQLWERSVKRLGRVPQNQQWIYVGDSGSDIYTFWQTCVDLGYDIAVRVAQDRVIEMAPEDALEESDEKYLKTLARALPATSARFLSIPTHTHQPKREVFLQGSVNIYM
ncbi:MAG TPA: transposase DNA-binding-containing protein [Dictyobacter sp.]|jgi:hypothetical protein|nr:transposase DNA-binding-containing protein [Dictyobacter sp.]